MFETDERSPYVDYEYYSELYCGTLISEDDFPKLELQAEAYVNAITFQRIPKLSDIPECVLNAICAAAESLKEYSESHETSSVNSESNDGYSISYGAAVTESDLTNNVRSKAAIYLAHTGLMYRGWSKIYDH